MDETFGPEQIHGAELLEQIEATLADKSETWHRVVLLDDYNPHEFTLDINKFGGQLFQFHATPHFVALESQLVPYHGQLLEDITHGRTRRAYERYILSKGKVPCAFLVAVWYLMRLGVYAPLPSQPIAFAFEKRQRWKSADYLVNILPERFRKVEDSARLIISHTPYAHKLDSISAHFFKSQHEGKSIDIIPVN